MAKKRRDTSKKKDQRRQMPRLIARLKRMLKSCGKHGMSRELIELNLRCDRLGIPSGIHPAERILRAARSGAIEPWLASQLERKLRQAIG